MENEERDLARRIGLRLQNAIAAWHGRPHGSQAALVRELDWLTPQALSAYVTGERMLSLDRTIKLAEFLKVKPAYLLCLEDSLTKREEALLNAYRHTDERGKQTIQRVAESEQKPFLSEYEKNRNAS